MSTLIGLVSVALLAYANGVNDNFKGVATLFGIGVVTGRARWKMIAAILGAWGRRCRLAALLGAGCMLILWNSMILR